MACTLESRHQRPPMRFLPIQSYNKPQICVKYLEVWSKDGTEGEGIFIAGGSTGTKDTLQGPHRPKQMTLSLYIYQYT